MLIFQVDAGTITDAATLTEPDQLGPCEPGTSVHLEGIVWHETDSGTDDGAAVVTSNNNGTNLNIVSTQDAPILPTLVQADLPLKKSFGASNLGDTVHISLHTNVSICRFWPFFFILTDLVYNASVLG